MPSAIRPYLRLEVSATLKAALHAGASLIHHGISDSEAPLPESVLKVRDQYEKLVNVRTMMPLAVYAAVLRTEEYVPRAQLFETDTLQEDGLPLCRAVRAPALFNPTYACLTSELESFFNEVGSYTGVAVWSTFILPAFGGLSSDEFLVLGLVRDVAGQEAVFLGSPAGIRWLAVEGEELANLVSSALLIGSAAIFHALNESLHRALHKTTVTRLSTPEHSLESALLTPEQAERAASFLWDRGAPPSRVLEAYFMDASQLVLSESMDLLDEITQLLQRVNNKVEAAAEAVRKQAAQAKRRSDKDLERLQMAYNGLKARVGRQEQLIKELRQSAGARPSTTHTTLPGQPAREEFTTALRGLFGRA